MIKHLGEKVTMRRVDELYSLLRSKGSVVTKSVDLSELTSDELAVTKSILEDNYNTFKDVVNAGTKEPKYRLSTRVEK